MFNEEDHTRVFGVAPGVDFPAALAKGILRRHQNRSPQTLARLTILVNTRRMQRRLNSIFVENGALLLPRIGLITDLEKLFPVENPPDAVPPLRRKLELMQLIAKLLSSSDGSVAPLSAAPDMADSLATLLDEMQSEGIAHDALQKIDTGIHAEHWQKNLQFLDIARSYTSSLGDAQLDLEARQRQITLKIIEAWQSTPPKHPIILAGSTGSRATTALLMAAVAKLPQGALLLPGFDFNTPIDVWKRLQSERDLEDHPQFRFAALLSQLEIDPGQVRNWALSDAINEQNALISLSMRPAEVTGSWLTEGPSLGDLSVATKNLSLIEATQPRHEAQAIAVALRYAVEKGQAAALITADRTLGRRVAAALLRWGIIADDSSGRPLSLTPPGRFLRQVGALIGEPAPADAFIALLKHPLTRSGDEDRGQHLLLTHEFELHLRMYGQRYVDQESLTGFVRARDDAGDWAGWLAAILEPLAKIPNSRLHECIDHHINLAEAFAATTTLPTGALWDKSAGRETQALIKTFRDQASFTAPVTFYEYLRLFEKALSAENTRNSDDIRSDVMIWGTLEARVQGADLVILGGLNEGNWPHKIPQDSWLNRSMRKQAGMLLPERQIGLAAHDYQQAVGAPEVILSRAKRDDDSETVPSRWLNRLTNLLEGLPKQGGVQALLGMRQRGDQFIEWAEQLETPASETPLEPRPAPAPPVANRPKELSITEVQTLIRDPYAIYAKHILRLRALQPLCPTPDARTRGIFFHKIAERALTPDAELSVSAFLATARKVLPDDWPVIRAQWLGQIESIAPRLITGEIQRRAEGDALAQEVKGKISLPGTVFSLKGTADRIDRLRSGDLAIFDYKTGAGPTAKQIRLFDRQLLIEAVMAEHGAFKDLAPSSVAKVSHVRLGRSGQDAIIDLNSRPEYAPTAILEELVKLLSDYMQPSLGYAAKRMIERETYDGDYDHLARFGEWGLTQSAKTLVLT